MQCRHFPHCPELPASVREELLTRKSGSPSSSNGTKKQVYWKNSALSLGFVDTNEGIRFAPRDVDVTMEDAPTNGIANPEEDESEDDDLAVSYALPELPRPNVRVVSPVEQFIEYNGVNFGPSTLVTAEDRELVRIISCVL